MPLKIKTLVKSSGLLLNLYLILLFKCSVEGRGATLVFPPACEPKNDLLKRQSSIPGQDDLSDPVLQGMVWRPTGPRGELRASPAGGVAKLVLRPRVARSNSTSSPCPPPSSVTLRSLTPLTLRLFLFLP